MYRSDDSGLSAAFPPWDCVHTARDEMKGPFGSFGYKRLSRNVTLDNLHEVPFDCEGFAPASSSFSMYLFDLTTR